MGLFGGGVGGEGREWEGRGSCHYHSFVFRMYLFTILRNLLLDARYCNYLTPPSQSVLVD